MAYWVSLRLKKLVLGLRLLNLVIKLCFKPVRKERGPPKKAMLPAI